MMSVFRSELSTPSSWISRCQLLSPTNLPAPMPSHSSIEYQMDTTTG